MTSTRKTQAIIAIAGLAGAAWCITLFMRHGPKDIFAAVLAAGWGVAAVVAFHLVPMFCDVMSWRAVIPPGHRLKNRELFLIRWMGDAVNSMLPVAQVGGEIVRMRVATFWGIPFNISAASVLVDMTLCVLTQILFALTGFWLLASLVGHNTIDRALILAIVVGLLAVGGFYMIQRIGIFRIGGAIVSSILKSPTWQKMAADGRAVDKTIAQLYGRRRSLVVCALWIMGAWSTGAVEVWIALHALGVPVSYAKAFVLESANQAIRSALFILPGALGAQEAGFLGFGTLLGISQEMSMALALIRRVRELAFGVPGVLAWQWVEWRRLRTPPVAARALPQETRRKYRHTIYSSVDQVPSEQWDALTAADIDLTMDRRLIGAMESKMGDGYSYATIVVDDGCGAAAAVACTWLLRLDLEQYPWLHRLIRILPRAVQERLKIGVLFCGMPLPFGQNHLRIAPGADRSAVIAELNVALRALARNQHCAMIVVKEFEAGECESLQGFCKAGFLRCEIPPRHRLFRQFVDFDEYRNALKSRYRAQVNRSLKKFSAAGFRVEQLFGPDQFCQAITDQAHQLYRNVFDRSKYKLEFYSLEFLRELGRRFGPDASLTCVHHGDRLAAFTIGLHSRGIYYNLISGLDYEMNPIGDVYFNLFYNDMDFAWKRGAKQIDLGLTSDDFKSRLGTRIEPLYLYIDSTRRLFSWAIKLSLPWTFPPLTPVPKHDVFKDVVPTPSKRPMVLQT